MVPLATSITAVREAINRFPEEVRQSQPLRSRLPYARAWYAFPDENGRWLYGPSKFIGYEGLTGDQYVELSEELDGRKTEAQLKKWFKQVDPSTDRYEQLISGLSAFLAEHGKTPCQTIRINIPRTVDNDSHDGASAALVDLIVAVAASLQPSELETLRRRLEVVGK